MHQFCGCVANLENSFGSFSSPVGLLQYVMNRLPSFLTNFYHFFNQLLYLLKLLLNITSACKPVY